MLILFLYFLLQTTTPFLVSLSLQPVMTCVFLMVSLLLVLPVRLGDGFLSSIFLVLMFWKSYSGVNK